MALRKDKIQALKDSLCLDNVDPSTRSALNNLVDNLIALFEATALPELPELEGLNTGQDELPVEEEPEVPVGEGEPLFFDPLDGFEGAPPGGGDDQGGGDGGGITCSDEGPEHVTFLATTMEEIPAAKNGIPGQGPVEKQQISEQGGDAQIESCRRECARQYQEDVEHLDNNIRIYEDRLREGGISNQIIDVYNEEIRTLRKQRRELSKPYDECLKNCEPDNDTKPEDVIHGSGYVFTAQNISCEKIEKDTQVIVSGKVNEYVCRDALGTAVSSSPIPGTEDLYITVESCGCD